MNAAHLDAARGDFRACLAELERGVPGAARLSLGSACWFADLPHHALVTEAELLGLREREPEERLAALPAALALSRARMLAFDGPALRASAVLVEQLTQDVHSPEAVLGHRLAALRVSVFAGDVTALESARALARDAKECSLAALLVEATALAALVSSEMGNFAEALDVARRAVRMGQTEGVRQEQYLCGLVLARIRRLIGQPHLASHILNALHKHASRPWRCWIDWELALASGAYDADFRSVDGFAADLMRCMCAAESGDRDSFLALSGALQERLANWRMAGRDWQRTRAVLDPEVAPQEKEVHAYRDGSAHDPPFGLSPMLGSSAPFAYVLAGAGAPAVRVAQRAITCFVRPERVGEASQRQQRAFTLISTVALAGADGLDEPQVFRSTYGFAYQRDLHRDLFNVLVHRARAALGDMGELVRENGRLSLTPNAATAFPDPRCAQPLSDRVLSLVSQSGGVGAKDISASLGVSLRSTQQALELLVEDGACVRAKHGRSVAYSVEDTTFQEPTRHDRAIG